MPEPVLGAETDQKCACGLPAACVALFIREACEYFPRAKTMAPWCGVCATSPRFHQNIEAECARRRAAETPDWMLT